MLWGLGYSWDPPGPFWNGRNLGKIGVPTLKENRISMYGLSMFSSIGTVFGFKRNAFYLAVELVRGQKRGGREPDGRLTLEFCSNRLLCKLNAFESNSGPFRVRFRVFSDVLFPCSACPFSAVGTPTPKLPSASGTPRSCRSFSGAWASFGSVSGLFWGLF